MIAPRLGFVGSAYSFYLDLPERDKYLRLKYLTHSSHDAEIQHGCNLADCGIKNVCERF